MRLRRLGFALGLGLVAGCRCPPPAACPAPPSGRTLECPEVTCPSVRPVKCPPCVAKVRPCESAAGGCLFGTVRTAGELVLVVQRAKVVVRAGPLSGETRTDTKGQFVVCLPVGQAKPPVLATIEVSKPPFEVAERVTELAPGQHQALEFALEAKGLTD